MTMKYLVARRFPRKVTLTVHLDTTKMLADGTTPDPDWCLSQTWALPQRLSGETNPAYVTRVTAWATATKADFILQCQARLSELVDALDPGVALAFEGTTF